MARLGWFPWQQCSDTDAPKRWHGDGAELIYNTLQQCFVLLQLQGSVGKSLLPLSLGRFRLKVLGLP